jgi:NAD(P)-dependent dehydrogenase (short-subunit alcohol dehydrogenase family)
MIGVVASTSAGAIFLPRCEAVTSSTQNTAIFSPAVGSLAGKTILITGANTGLGLETALRLRRAGARVIVTARSAAKVAQSVAKLEADSLGNERVTGIELDLASLASIKSFPARLAAATSNDLAIDVLLNNAGVMAIPKRLETDEGFERTIGVNHLGHFALTAEMLPFLKRASHGFRVVTVSSEAHKFASAKQVKEALERRLEDTSYSGWGAYGLSKVANVLFAMELQRRFDAAGLAATSVALHPGAVQTDLGRYIVGGLDAGDIRPSESSAPPSGVGKLVKGLLDKVILPIDRGANTQVFLAAGEDSGGAYNIPTALYFDSMTPVKASATATDLELAKRLWEVSEELTGEYFL